MRVDIYDSIRTVLTTNPAKSPWQTAPLIPLSPFCFVCITKATFVGEEKCIPIYHPFFLSSILFPPVFAGLNFHNDDFRCHFF